MTALGTMAGPHPTLTTHWLPTPQADDAAAEHARALAHAALVQTSLKVASLRAAAQTRLLDARTEAEEIIEAARVEAESIRCQAREDAEAIHEQALIEARRSTIHITDRALDRRDVLILGTVEKIANLSTTLLGMADQLLANAIDRPLAEHQLDHFMLALTEMVPEFSDFPAAYPAFSESAGEPDLNDDERLAA